MVNANLNQPGWSFVYFIQAGENGPIKIGATGDPSGRLRALRTANAAPLKCLLLLRGAEHEPILHSLFASIRLQGEWFSPCDDLTSFLQQMIELADVEIDVDDEHTPFIMMPSPRRYDRPGFSTQDVIEAVKTMPERHVLSQFTSDDWDRFVDECPRPKVSDHRSSGRWDYPGVIMSWLNRNADGENDLMK